MGEVCWAICGEVEDCHDMSQDIVMGCRFVTRFRYGGRSLKIMLDEV